MAVRYSSTMGLVDPVTSFWLLLLAVSLARLQLPVWETVIASCAFLVAAAMLVLLPVGVPVLATVIGIGMLVVDRQYGTRHSGIKAIGYGLRPLLPYGLLRALSNGPWPQGVGLFITLAGGALALGAGIRAVRSSDPRRGQSLALFGAALAGVGLASPLAIIAVCWTLLLLACLGVDAALRLQTPMPLMAAFVAWWLLVAAAAASQSWLLVSTFVLVALCCGMAAVRVPRRPGRLPISDGAVLLLMLVGSLLSGVEIKNMLSVADHLAIGLTQLGIVDAWPWIGVGALNAGHQRVMVLPVVVWSAIGLVVLAVALLVTPCRRHLAASEQDEHGDDLWRMIEHRIWWLGHG